MTGGRATAERTSLSYEGLEERPFLVRQQASQRQRLPQEVASNYPSFRV